MNSEALNIITATLTEYNMLPENGKILIALSGGADSVALLRLLFSLKDKFGLTLFAVHLNHNLRGSESLRDEQFVGDLCAELSVPLYVYSEDIKYEAERHKKGIEEYARRRRYELFSALADELSAVIATAHNLNDVAETLIFNITRGCGINGISSISPVRGNIIRPLINMPRAVIERYLSDNGYEYVTDSTNLSDDYTRNKIRHNVIPVLCEINPSFLQSVSRLTKSAEAVNSHIANAAAALIESFADRKAVADCDDAVILEYIRRRCSIERGIIPEYSQALTALNIIKKGQGMAQLAKGEFLYIDGGQIKIGEAQTKNQPFCLPFDINGVKTPYNNYSFRVIDKKEYDKCRKINNLLLKNALDYDKISNSLILRSRNSGDNIRIFGRNCTKSLKKLYCEQKIPIHLRNRLCVLSNDKNDILWAECCGADERFAVTDRTKRVLVINTDKELI